MASGTVGLQTPSQPDRLIDNEVVENEQGQTVMRQRVAVMASRERKLLDYDGRADGNPVYVGFNDQGALVGDETWVVFKLFYDLTGRLVDQQVVAGIAWTDRAAADWRAPGGD